MTSGGSSSGPIESRYASSSLSVSRPSAAMIAATRLLASITASALCSASGRPLNELELVGDAGRRTRSTSRSIGPGMGPQATPSPRRPGAPGPSRAVFARLTAEVHEMSRRRVSKAIIAVVCAVGLPAACAESSSVRPATGSSPSSVEPGDHRAGATAPASLGRYRSAWNQRTAGSLPSATDGSTPPMGSEQIDPGLKPYIDIAVADLAQRLTVDPSDDRGELGDVGRVARFIARMPATRHAIRAIAHRRREDRAHCAR